MWLRAIPVRGHACDLGRVASGIGRAVEHAGKRVEPGYAAIDVGQAKDFVEHVNDYGLADVKHPYGSVCFGPSLFQLIGPLDQ